MGLETVLDRAAKKRTTISTTLKPKLVYIIFKNPDRTSQRTQHFITTNISLLTLLKETTAVYTDK
jgi:hypothetical protein